MLRLVRNPVLLNFNKLSTAFKHLLDVKLRNAQLFMRRVQTLEILVTPEHNDASIDCTVSLCSLEAFNCIMQSCICWIKLEWCVLNDFRFLPSAIVFVIVDVKHVVSSDAAKSICMIWTWLGFQVSGWDYFQIRSHESVF